MLNFKPFVFTFYVYFAHAYGLFYMCSGLWEPAEHVTSFGMELWAVLSCLVPVLETEPTPSRRGAVGSTVESVF